MPARGDVTRLLADLCLGKPEAGEALFPLVYKELYALAQGLMARERPDHTLQATALVHEAYLRLGGKAEAAWENRRHFLRIAARAMRAVLVDHEKRRRAGKRGSGWSRVPLLDGEPIVNGPAELDYESLDKALHRLAEVDARCAEVVELRFFGGLSIEEVAEILHVSLRTVKGDWRLAKAWLAAQLGEAH